MSKSTHDKNKLSRPKRARHVVSVTLPIPVIAKLNDLRQAEMRRYNTDMVEVLIHRAHALTFPVK